jgi:hypothetical protein
VLGATFSLQGCEKPLGVYFCLEPSEERATSRCGDFLRISSRVEFVCSDSGADRSLGASRFVSVLQNSDPLSSARPQRPAPSGGLICPRARYSVFGRLAAAPRHRGGDPEAIYSGTALGARRQSRSPIRNLLCAAMARSSAALAAYLVTIARVRQPVNLMRSPSAPPVVSHRCANVCLKRCGLTFPIPACTPRRSSI